MPITYRVVAVLYGTRASVDVVLASHPTLRELIESIESTLTGIMKERAPRLWPVMPFKVHRLCWDTGIGEWEDCVDPPPPGTTLLALQLAQSSAMVPVRAVSPPSHRISPPRSFPRPQPASPSFPRGLPSLPSPSPRPPVGGSPHHPAAPLHHNMAEAIFAHLAGHTGTLPYAKFEEGLLHQGRLGIDPSTLAELFHKLTAGDPVATLSQWGAFCAMYPTLTETLHARLFAKGEAMTEQHVTREYHHHKEQRRVIVEEMESIEREKDAQRSEAGRWQQQVEQAAGEVARAREKESEATRARDAHLHAVRHAEFERDDMRVQHQRIEAELEARRDDPVVGEYERIAAQAAENSRALAAAEQDEQAAKNALTAAMHAKQKLQKEKDRILERLSEVEARYRAVVGSMVEGLEGSRNLLDKAEEDLAEARRHQDYLSERVRECMDRVHRAAQAHETLQLQRPSLPPERIARLDVLRSSLAAHDARETELKVMVETTVQTSRAKESRENHLVAEEILLRKKRDELEAQEAKHRHDKEHLREESTGQVVTTKTTVRHSSSSSSSIQHSALRDTSHRMG
eukprot:Sspe_Gene.9408::Locus_3164_Transcript_2_3_Confidence_0.400_Length_1962::g.9408::m.9408